VVHSAYRVDLSHLDSGGVTNGIRSDLHGHERVRVTGVDMRLIACVGLAGCIAHVPALDVRSRVLRGNVPGHRLPSCGCVGSTRTSYSLRGGGSM